MPDAPYANREIQELFKAADERADAFHGKLMQHMEGFEDKTSGKLNSIEEQTKKTNGLVADINKWRERINGGSMVAGVFMTLIVMPILCWAIFVLVNINSVIHKSVDEALSAYDITKTE